MIYHSNFDQIDRRMMAITDRVCSWYGLSPSAVFNMSRLRSLVEPRQLAWYFMRNHVKTMSGIQIPWGRIASTSKLYGKKHKWNHASVIHAHKSITSRCQVERIFKTWVQEREDEIKTMLRDLNGGKVDSYSESLSLLLGKLSMNVDAQEVETLIYTLDNMRKNYEKYHSDPLEDHFMALVQRK